VNTSELMRELSSSGSTAIDRETLAALLEAAEVLRQDDTCIAGMIRILSVDGVILVQEETPDREVLARSMATREAADAFVNDRLEIYERMWDGCGCKINYSD
jgi:uncharacterized protein YicC (UPF0701 family)